MSQLIMQFIMPITVAQTSSHRSWKSCQAQQPKEVLKVIHCQSQGHCFLVTEIQNKLGALRCLETSFLFRFNGEHNAIQNCSL